jgi:hypothetical protein
MAYGRKNNKFGWLMSQFGQFLPGVVSPGPRD